MPIGGDSWRLLRYVLTVAAAWCFSAIVKLSHLSLCFDHFLVAVTGIPDAQPDHAVRMCKFANEVSTKMNHLVAQLAVKFGEDTLAMKLRVGLHSVSVIFLYLWRHYGFSCDS